MLPVAELAVDAVRRCLDAAADVAEERWGRRQAVSLEPAAVHAAFASERLLRIDGAPAPAGFAPLSRFWRGADGWLRTHGNYPWHAAALVSALGVGADGVEAALAALPVLEAEERIVAAGGVAAAVRTRAEWAAGPVARAAAARPLVELELVGDAPARPWPDEPAGWPAAAGDAGGGSGLRASESVEGGRGSLPLAGIRVLDLTRVIAGPVATRMLGALGADVLRVDPPQRPELPLHLADGLLGKRWRELDATTTSGRAELNELVAWADVVVTGYRPGALDRLGLAPTALAYRHPGTVCVTLSAWGTTGPWQRRRGFDSLVQAACGIGALLADGDGKPGALPCQFLDHASGYLAAAGAIEALVTQRAQGGTVGAWVSLARTAQWLLDAPEGAEPFTVPDTVALQRVGDREVVPPPGALDGEPLRWSA